VNRDDRCESISPGCYIVRRAVVIEGRRCARRIECTNPAYGFLRLDEWEHRERALAEEAKVRQALGEPQPRSKKGCA
jgi:hypothetical protein